ncbi:hypothetical protein EAT49_06645 [Histidinibacterium lentulum]|uniref:DUF2125 domain-containing protein n=1 Tax=Histidinibacterium lentulum TaxID=2480588 RepID=A0A3N2R653_9RHOB|nr:hypothetical protein EAT49_06645 [Histidinibacterium lentulum]
MSAQVTPEDVWAIQRDFYAATGLQVSAQESRSGDTLTLSDVTGTVVLPQGLGTISAILGPVDLTAQDDGSVTVAYRQPSQVRLVVDVMSGTPDELYLDVALTGTQETASTLATGSPDAIVFTTEAGRTTVSLTGIEVRGAPDIEGMDLSGITAVIDIQDTVNVATVTRDEATLTMDVQSVSGPTASLVRVDMQSDIGFLLDNSGSSASGVYSGRAVVPAAGIDYVDLASSIRAGLSLDVTTRSEGLSSISITSDPMNGESRQVSETATSEGRVSLGEAGLSIEGSTGEASLEYEDTLLIPFTIRAGVLGSQFLMQMPLLASDTPQGARLALAFEGLSLDERLVRLLDPSELLPRDPISFEFDIEGEMMVLADLVDFLTLGEMINGGVSPVEPTSVTLNSGAFSGAGVGLTSSGSFTIDLNDPTFLDGLPFRPTGSAQARATGVNGLIDTLVTMGLVAEEDAGIARLGLGMFSRNLGDDVLESSLEVTPEGSITVNGNRIR